MINRLLPERADNDYRGYKAALWLFGVLLFLKTGTSLGSVLNGHAAATTADGIPIDSYGATAAATLLSLFTLLGLANLMLTVIGIIVLARYRALVPLMFVIFLVYALGRKVILLLLPVVRVGTPPGGAINLAILVIIVVGLLLSMVRPAQRP